MNAGDPFLFATSKIPIAVRGLTKKEAADSTGRDWSRTQVPGKHDVDLFEKFELISRTIPGGLAGMQMYSCQVPARS